MTSPGISQGSVPIIIKQQTKVEGIFATQRGNILDEKRKILGHDISSKTNLA